MNISFRTHILARALGAALLLSAAFAAWGVTITLTDGSSNSVSCTTSSDITVRRTSGDIVANVDGTTASCNLSGTSTPPPTGSFNLTVNTGGTGTGTVTSTDSAITCPGSCVTSYASSTPVTLNAVNDTGSTFAGWSGGGCSGTGACIVTMSTSVSVTATFNADVVAGTCGALPANTIVVDTGSLATDWKQQTFLPIPQTITALKVTVPSTFTGRDIFYAAVTASSMKAKLVVVSACPGVLTPVGGQGSCSLAGSDTTTVRLSGKSSDASYYCKLTPGATYYLNAVSKNNVTDTSYNCSNTTNCSFYASRGTPY